jgi:hypothetical protein
VHDLNEHDIVNQPAAQTGLSTPRVTPAGCGIRTTAIVTLTILLAVVFGVGLFAGWVMVVAV